MYSRRMKLFDLFGFTVYVDLSWIFIAALVVWSLGDGLFPDIVEGLEPLTYWAMGVMGAIGLFASIIFHELSHSLVARRYGIPIEGITLFIFGGVAEMTEEPHEPKAEFLMALAGPVASFVLWAVFLVCYEYLPVIWPPAVLGVLEYLSWINGLLAAFNMIPAFPLDGGRVLRAILWSRSDDVRQATRTASSVGGLFGLAFMFAGAFFFLTGNIVGGIWWFLIGIFMRSASSMTDQQTQVRSYLHGQPVSRFMTSPVVSISEQISIRDLVENFFYEYHHKLFPVFQDGRLIGQVTINRIRDVDPADWDTTFVGDITERVCAANTISEDEDAMEALAAMTSAEPGNRRSRLMVIAPDGSLAGILTVRDLLDYFNIRSEIETAKKGTE